MPLKPWYKVVTPRADLREGKPLDAAEFAVHLDQVRDRRAPAVYQDPEQFFDRTYLTKNLLDLASQAVRRLSGEKTGTSAVFNLATQFGGGKTHALTLLYHLAKHGPQAAGWTGASKILEAAEQKTIPEAAVAVFVGTEFDPVTGRGGADGTPLRMTPWGEIAFQLGGAEALKVLEKHEQRLTAPAGDVIRSFLPKDKPVVVLMDELMNFISRSRRSGMAAQLYSFLQNLSEEARGRDKMILAVSIPASELEMNAEDQADYERIKKLLDRLGKAVMMAAESETAEIIRRRLFEWDQKATSADGRILLSREAHQTCQEFADWVREHRQQLPGWFSSDNAREAFLATYPFHPVVLSVFERKWQSLPRFQQTRGVLRLLALWVARAYQDGFKGGHRDPLIGLGTAPLEDPLFRAATFEQLGESRLEAAVTTDIVGRPESHAVRLDAEAVEAIRLGRLHRKSALSIFFESNGGMAKAEATIPEIRLAVGEPNLDIGHVETVSEALAEACYYLTSERNKYRFGITPNLNKLLSDRKASIPPRKVEERVHEEIRKVFSAGKVEKVFFPDKSSAIPNRPMLTMVILAPEQSMENREATESLIENMTREYGASGRTFKSALIWCVPETATQIRDETKKLLAWEEIRDEESNRLEETQKRLLAECLKKAERDLKESVWRSYKYIFLLGKDNKLKTIDLGLVHSSAADSPVSMILNRLRQDGEVEPEISPNFLVRNWPSALEEWSTKSVRDAFFASPLFPRLLVPDAVKSTIARGVENGLFAYCGKLPGATYEPFFYKTAMPVTDVELSEDVCLIKKESAEAYRSRLEQAKGSAKPKPAEIVAEAPLDQKDLYGPPAKTESQPPRAAKSMIWRGEIPPQKWMNFYMKVLSRFAVGGGLKLTIIVEIAPPSGVTLQIVEETRQSIRELGLGDSIDLG
jgi:hypothetical protein